MLKTETINNPENYPQMGRVLKILPSVSSPKSK